MLLKDRVAIVTGGGIGLGKTIVMTLAREGAHVAVAARTPEALDRVAGEVRKLGVKSLAVPTDLTQEGQVKAMVEQVHKEFGQIDVLVNNAAFIGPHGSFMNTPGDTWLYTFQVNVLGALFCSREVLRTMIPRKSGVIVNISSLASVEPFLPTSAYSVSKAGLNNLTRMIAREMGPHGIRANALALGPVDRMDEARPRPITSLGTTTGAPPPAPDPVRVWNFGFSMAPPPGRSVPATDIAATVAFLASDHAKSITGQVIPLVTHLD